MAASNSLTPAPVRAETGMASDGGRLMHFAEHAFARVCRHLSVESGMQIHFVQHQNLASFLSADLGQHFENVRGLLGGVGR